ASSRREDAGARSTPPGIAVPIPTVGMAVGSAWAISRPTVIPASNVPLLGYGHVLLSCRAQPHGAAGIAWQRLPADSLDDLVHTGYPGHAGKDNVHTGVMFLHSGGGAAVPHHHAIVVLISGVP